MFMNYKVLGSFGSNKPKKSDIFSRCKYCNGLKIRGICQKCGAIERCCVCKGVIQPDRTARKMSIDPHSIITDTYCKDCLKVAMDELING